MSSPRSIDISGRFGRLVVLRREGRISGYAAWRCLCDCGLEIVTRGDLLRKGRSRSCGCYARDRSTTHGHSKDGVTSPTYRTWVSMVSRCTNPNVPAWFSYGGRGISVCERWLTFANFLADMGERPIGRSLDRICNDEGYNLSNCRWATAKEQANNRRPARYSHPRYSKARFYLDREIAEREGAQ